MQVNKETLRPSLTEHLVEGGSTQADSGRPSTPGPTALTEDQLPELLVRMQEQSAVTYRMSAKVLCVCGCRSGALLGLESGEVVHVAASQTILAKHFGAVTCLASLESQFVSGSEDLSVQLWRFGDSKALATFSGHSKAVTCLSFTPDRTLLVSGSLDLTVRVWSLEELKEVACLQGHLHFVKCVAVTKDSRRAISGALDNTLIIWSLETMAMETTLAGHTGGIWCLTITTEYVISGSWDNSLKVWSLEERKEVATLEGLTREGSCIPVSGDGQCAISGSHENSLRIWPLATSTPGATLLGHTAPITSVALTPDSKFIVSASEDHTLKVWSYADKTEVATLKGHTDWVTGVVITPDAKAIVSLSLDGTVKLWSLDDMKELATFIGHSDTVTGLAVSEECAVSTSNDKNVKVWNLRTMHETATLQGHTDKVCCVTLAQDGSVAVTGSKDATLRVWDLQTGTELRAFQEHTGPVYCAITLPGGKDVASGSQDQSIRVWNVHTGAEVAVLKDHCGGVWCLAEADGKLVSGSDDHSIKVWDLSSLQCVKTYSEHKNWVRCIALRGNRMLSAAADQTIKVWDLRLPESEFTINSEEVMSLALTPDCLFALAGAKVYSLLDMKEMANLSASETVTAVVISADGKNALLAAGKTFSVINIKFELQPYRLAHFKDLGTSTADTVYQDTYSLLCANIERLTSGKPIHLQVASHVVYPYFFNSLHVCAFYNRFKRLARYLAAGVPCIRGQFGSPLTVALRRNTRKCVEVILEHLLNCPPATIAEVTDDLPALACSRSSLITPFFEQLLRPSVQPGLPQFICPLFPLPIVQFLPGAFIRSADFIRSGDVQNAEVVEFQVCQFRWNFSLGSHASLSLLRALEHCTDSRVLTTEIVTTIIEEKWKLLWPLTLLMTLLYVALLCGLVFLQYGWGGTAVWYLFFVLNAFFLGYEILQSVVCGKDYWKDVWNCLDCIRGVVTLLWVLRVVPESLIDTSHLQFAVVGLCFIRGFTFFRTFKMTRLFVRMTLEVVKEIYSFLIILLYSTFAFGLMYSALNPTELDSLPKAWVVAYELIMGQFKNDDYNAYQWLCFTGASLLNVIIMLNLLISILGDAYERAQMSARENDLSEMLRLVIEYESMLFWRRKQGAPTVLVKCASIRATLAEDEWEGRVSRLMKGVKKEVSVLDTRVSARLDALEARVKSQMDSIEGKVESILRVLNSL